MNANQRKTLLDRGYLGKSFNNLLSSKKAN